MSLSKTINPAAGEPAAEVRRDERHRLSCDLHDTVGPALAGIRLRLDTAATMVAHAPEAHRLIIQAAEETARTAQELRQIIDGLSPTDLHLGLPGALRRLAARLDEGARMTIVLDVPDVSPRLPTEVEVATYRIASESLTNVVRHADAGQVTLRLALDDEHIVLEVTDDGVGPQAVRHARGIGLSSMTRRAQEVGGRCDVLPRGDGRSGTLVRAVLPGQAA
ncbi:sensor histidine kinase [Nonomuraea cavernae]|uniref:Histidine kinase domain-containing protein n=1 Tax=Nonomuraea cavernae TaxID=2045107 RepID=A0A917YP19_9ACTN|nr:sensor histidine kinase [Nonomuraea cavernae]MCA2183745.1 sensor histidine kinase [Nonomuraea cavernae]GGO61237.1 hypothetical protein GCM10012289_02990 [Nonomuraea cavernae]